MRLPHRAAITLGVLVLAAGAALAAQARSTATTAWTRISGPTQAGNQLGLARTADGVLHVIWNRGNVSTSIYETRFSPVGKAVGTSTVASGWDGNGGLALLAMPDRSLRLFAAGAGGINSFTAPSSGGSWTQSAGRWGGAVAESAYVIGATLTKDGQPVTAWRGNAAAGVPSGSIPPSGYEGGMTESFLATDAGSGAVVLSGATNAGQGGVYAQQILPSASARVVLPPLGKEWGNGLSGRIGAPGVYIAYADGNAAHLYRFGGGSKTLARGAFWSATDCAGPAGRLWVAWGDTGDGLLVTRSNRAVSAFEPVQKVKLPQDELAFVQCEGSTGPLDLFASASLGGGFWHAHLLATLSLRAKVAKGKATLSVHDAGDPVGGVAVTVGGKRASTDAKGQATLGLRPGAYSATVKAAGFRTANVRFKVPKSR
jgi:hypothetical protein